MSNRSRSLVRLARVVGGAALLLGGALTVPAHGAGAPIDYNGADLYQLNCANCHGVYGEGDGAITPDLSVVLLDLRYLSARNDGSFPEAFVRSIVDGRITRAAHGPEGMPVWGAEFTRGEGLDEAARERVAAKLDALVDFLRSMQLDD